MKTIICKILLLISLVGIQFSFGSKNSGIPGITGPTALQTPVYTRNVNYQENTSSFNIAIITDTHIGQSANYNATYSQGTPPAAGNDGIEADYLRGIVKWINDNKDSYNIKFIIVTGDITDKASLWQFVKAKEILDQLTIPYIPMMGNHDV